MGDFFKAGETHANRLGEYEVIEVKTPTLVIRYTETGRLQEVEEELQERIVRNLRREHELANQPPEERRTTVKAPRQRRRRAKFDGFAAADFHGNVSGTTWRAKTGLGGLLAQTLGDRTGEMFDSWAPNKQTVCYITSPEEAEQQILGDSAQFYVKTSSTGVAYGLSIHRPAEAAEGSTAWDRLLTALSEDEPTAALLTDLLTSEQAELSWSGETWSEAEKETVRGDDEGLQLDRGSTTENDTMEALVERLNEAPQDQGLILTLESAMALEDTLAAGPGVADTVCDMFEQLIGLYRACKG